MPRRRRQLATDDRLTAATGAALDSPRSAISIVLNDDGGRASGPGGNDRADRHPVTGCKADTLFGVWLMPEDHLQVCVDTAWALVESGQLAETADRSRIMRAALRGGTDVEIDDEAADGPPALAVEDRVGFITIEGPLTKHPTSFSSVLGGTAYAHVRSQLREATVMHGEGKLDGIFIDGDSWGGNFEGATETAAAIRRAAEVMPVHTHVEDKATSGMQWLASMGSRVTGGNGAIFGSVGARTSLIDRSENFKRQGLKPYVFTTGEEKAIGAPGVEISEKQRAAMQRHVEQVGAVFINDVAKQRNLNPEQLAEVKKAGLHVGADALRVGLCDGICSREQALADLKSTIAQGGRGTAPGSTTPAAHTLPIGVTTMPLTAAQLDRAKKLPGCSTIGENDVDAVLTAAQATAESLTAANTKLGELTTERDALKKIAPPTLTPDVKAARVAAARSRIELLGHKGVINAAQRAKIEAGIGEAGKENDAPFTGVAGSTPIELQLAVFDDAARTAPAAGSVTGAQLPGAAQAAASGVVIPDARINSDPAAVGSEQGAAYKAQRLQEMGQSK